MKKVVMFGAVALVLLSSAAMAGVFVRPADPNNPSQVLPENPSVYVGGGNKPQSNTMGEQGINTNPFPVNPQDNAIKSGAAMSAADYNRRLEEQRNPTDPYGLGLNGLKPPATVTPTPLPTTPPQQTEPLPTITDDEYTYFDPVTNQGYSKSKFAYLMWSRGEDPNTYYAGSFPDMPKGFPKMRTVGRQNGQRGSLQSPQWENFMPD